MKKFYFSLVIIWIVLTAVIYAAVTQSDFLMTLYYRGVARHFGFYGDLWFDHTQEFSYYYPGKSTIVLGWASRATLAHEIEHHKYYCLVYGPTNNEALKLSTRLKTLKLGGISPYSDTYPCKDNNSCLLAYNETLAEVADLDHLGLLRTVPKEWQDIYFDINNWYQSQLSSCQ
jgi:hypothetical protein